MVRSAATAFLLALMLASPAHAQLKSLYTFDACPYNLVVSGSTLYATLSANGGNNPVFAFDTKAGTGSTIYTLPGEGRIVAAANGILYGSVSGGTSSTLFSFNPATSAYQSLYEFPSGAASTLTYHNGVLYGTNVNGGANGAGTVFKYDTATGKYRTLYSFSGGMTDGHDPAVAPVFSGGYLYILSSSALLKLRASNGQVVWDSPFSFNQGGFGVVLALRQHTLFGVNQSYGANDAGTIFSANPGTGALSLLYTFSSVSGSGAALFHGETLFGTWAAAQQGDAGGVFSYAVPGGTFAEGGSFPADTNPQGIAVSMNRTGYTAGYTPGSDGGYCALYSFPL